MGGGGGGGVYVECTRRQTPDAAGTKDVAVCRYEVAGRPTRKITANTADQFRVDFTAIS